MAKTLWKPIIKSHGDRLPLRHLLRVQRFCNAHATLAQIRGLAYVGRWMADDMANWADCQREELQNALTSHAGAEGAA